MLNPQNRRFIDGLETHLDRLGEPAENTWRTIAEAVLEWLEDNKLLKEETK